MDWCREEEKCNMARHGHTRKWGRSGKELPGTGNIFERKTGKLGALVGGVEERRRIELETTTK